MRNICGHNMMSPLQGFRFSCLLRRALPYAIELRPFRAEKFRETKAESEKCCGTKAESLTFISVGQRPTLDACKFSKPCRGVIRWMSPLQGFRFSRLLRRALPYADELRPFRAEEFRNGMPQITRKEMKNEN